MEAALGLLIVSRSGDTAAVTSITGGRALFDVRHQAGVRESTLTDVRKNSLLCV
jgi:hypothetical protein